MAKPIMMPKQGITVESCVLTKWHKKVGETIKVGEVLFSYETDKAAFDQESEVEGVVLAEFYADGDEVPVLTNIGAVGNAGESFAEFAPEGASKEAKSESSATVAVVTEEKVNVPQNELKTEETASAAVEKHDGRVFVSPRAKALADKLGVELNQCLASGPKGRIVECDVREASVNPHIVEEAAVPAAAEKAAVDVHEFTDEKLSHIRKVIAKTMLGSLQSMAQLTHNISFDMTNVMAFRAYVKANAEQLGLPNITINDIILFAVSRVIKNYKMLNANLINGDTMRYFSSANLGVAVDTPRGLLVPTLFGADTLTLQEISVQAKKLAKEAQSGSINPEKLTGGSFTVSNLGSFGIEHFTPVINPPQTGILGVNTIETRVRFGQKGELEGYSAMNLSLTYDHRALDGGPASKFLKDLKIYLENFSYNLIFDNK